MNNRYMSEQEREHYDHVAGSASEFQNCFTEAEQMASRQAYEHGKPISDALAAGLFCVVDREPYYCRATDAIAGSVEYLRSVHPNRSEADAAAAELYAAEGANSDGEIYVLPAAPVFRPVVVASDDVPF